MNSSTNAVSRGPRVRRQPSLPESMRRVSPPFDYVDVFTATTDAAALASPERWARAGVEDAAGSAGQFVWRRILALRLDGRPSPERIGGWTIADRGDDWIRLEARSWCLTAHILVQAGRTELTIATFIRYDRPPASLVWPRLAVAHRRAMPGLMRRAVRSVTGSSR